MNAYEPHVRRRGYFLSESGSEPDFSDSESAEGIRTPRVNRPRRARKVVTATGRPQRHRAAVSSHVSRPGERKTAVAKSEIATGSRRP